MTQTINGREYITCATHNSMYRADSECSMCYAERQKRQHREQREQKAKELRHSAAVGDFVYTTWGYEQTNVTFWQVTRKTGKCLFGRKVTTRLVDSRLPNGQPAFAGYAYPVRGEFKSDEARVNLHDVDLYDGISGVSASWYA